MDVFAVPGSPLAELREASAELNSAIADLAGWVRVVPGATTCVAATHLRSFTTIIGCEGRWRIVRAIPRGPVIAGDPVGSAAAAVELVEGPEPMRIGPSARRRARRARQGRRGGRVLVAT